MEGTNFTSELARDLAVSATDVHEFALERNVSPPNDVAVGDEGTWRENESRSDVVGVDAPTSDSGEEIS